jgi:hypothetical protein
MLLSHTVRDSALMDMRVEVDYAEYVDRCSNKKAPVFDLPLTDEVIGRR